MALLLHREQPCMALLLHREQPCMAMLLHREQPCMVLLLHREQPCMVLLLHRADAPLAHWRVEYSPNTLRKWLRCCEQGHCMCRKAQEGDIPILVSVWHGLMRSLS